MHSKKSTHYGTINDFIVYLFLKMFETKVFWAITKGLAGKRMPAGQGYNKLYRKIPWDLYRGMELP